MKSYLKSLRLAAIMATMMLSFASCVKAGNFSIRDYRISSIMPGSLHDIDGSIVITVENSGNSVTFESGEGTLYHKDSPLGSFRINEFSIPKKQTSDITISGTFHISDDFGISDVLGIIRDFSLDNLIVDMQVKVRAGLLTRTITKKNIQVRKLMNRTNK